MSTASQRSFSSALDASQVDARPPDEPQRAPFEDGVTVFMRVRPRLFGIAYRILRSAAEAEDVVQEVWLRWQTTDRTRVRDAVAFLATTARRLSINVLQSARTRRERCGGPPLPEPIDGAELPGVAMERRQALTLGLQLVWERLSPAERAAYILREAFSYAYRDIAAILRLREANARQLVTRARRHLAQEPHLRFNRGEQTGVLAALRAAAAAGEVGSLEAFFAGHLAGPATGERLVRSALPNGSDRTRAASLLGRYAA